MQSVQGLTPSISVQGRPKTLEFVSECGWTYSRICGACKLCTMYVNISVNINVNMHIDSIRGVTIASINRKGKGDACI